jgi:RNA polymerase sigma-70 factor (ECF subfamily)
MGKSATKERIENFYCEHKDHVFNYVVRLTLDRDLALDVTQQTFLKALADPKLAGVEHPKAYLLTIARNTLYDEWKRKKEKLLIDDEQAVVDELPDDPLEAPQARAERQDMKTKIEHTISRMHPKFRELMLLRYGEDLSLEEIATITGRSLSDVKVNLHRARLQFEHDFSHLLYARVARARQRCATLGELLAPYADRELPTPQIRDVDAHLSTCAVCTRDLEHMKKSRELFAALPLVPAPAVLDRLLETSLSGGSAVSSVASKSAAIKTVAIKAAVIKVVAGTAVVAVLGTGYFVATHRPVEIMPTVTAPPPAESQIEPPPPSTTPSKKKTETAGQGLKRKWNGPSFTAETVDIDPVFSTDHQTHYQSKAGTRAEGIRMGDKQLTMIVNFTQAKAWFVNPANKTYVEDYLDADGNMTGSLKAMNVKAGSNVDAASTLDWQPCEGFELKKMFGAEKMLGRITEHWACTKYMTRVEIQQWYDPQLRVVIRDSRAGGRVSELHNIQLTELPDNLFQPPQGYRKVSLNEMTQ